MLNYEVIRKVSLQHKLDQIRKFSSTRNSLCNWNEIQGNIPRHNFDLVFTEEGRKSQGAKLE